MVFVVKDDAPFSFKGITLMGNTQNSDVFFMRLAIAEARKALSQGEVPIGAVIAAKGTVIARAHNLTETLSDPTAHAEMQALTAAAHALGSKYLQDCTLYVTVEPCPMCAAACYWAQVGEIVYGAGDPKRGHTTIPGKLLHPKTKVRKGVMEEECGTLIADFFKKVRDSGK